MTIAIPPGFETRARAEVAAGRAKSVEQLAAKALEAHRLDVERFRASLDNAVAEADRDGWIEGEVVLAEMDALIDQFEREASQTQTP